MGPFSPWRGVSEVADEGEGHQIWTVAANIFNKQSQLTKGCPPAWGLDRGLTTPHYRKPACCEMFHRVSDLDSRECE
jgi:hypothetical protein